MANVSDLAGEGFMKSMDTVLNLPETAINVWINLSQHIAMNWRNPASQKADAVFSGVGHNHVGILIACGVLISP